MTFPLVPRDRRIHVFSVSDGPLTLAHQTYLSRLEGEGRATPLTDAFGAPVDATYAEVFAVRDVEPMGLRAYLAQAHDIPAATLARDAARLDALSGDVVVLAPSALEGLGALDPRPEITHIGSYAPAEADDAPRALPRAGRTPGPVAEIRPSRSLSARTIAVIVGVALLISTLLFLL